MCVSKSGQCYFLKNIWCLSILTNSSRFFVLFPKYIFFPLNQNTHRRPELSGQKRPEGLLAKVLGSPAQEQTHV